MYRPSGLNAEKTRGIHGAIEIFTRHMRFLNTRNLTIFTSLLTFFLSFSPSSFHKFSRSTISSKANQTSEILRIEEGKIRKDLIIGNNIRWPEERNKVGIICVAIGHWENLSPLSKKNRTRGDGNLTISTFRNLNLAKI